MGIAEGDLLRWSQMVSNAALQIRDAHNPRLLLELLVARMASLDKMADLRVLLEGGAPAAAPRSAGTTAPPAAAPSAPVPPPAVRTPAPLANPTHPEPSAAPAADGGATTFAQAVEQDDKLMALTREFDAVPHGR